jgi:orotidine-5'-phosphate decarboxylase
VSSSPSHFSDRLAASILRRRSVVCVGLDPMLDRLPPSLVEPWRDRVAELGDEGAVAGCLAEFCRGVIEAVADVAACVKPQAAFFEQYGAPGWEALAQVVRHAHEHELPVILDAKRGDIASTGAAYAHAAFGGARGLTAPVPGLGADAVTVNPYLGEDSLAPFVEAAGRGHGLFVLARTSNPGAATLQEQDSGGRALYLHVAEMVARLGASSVGRHGYSDIGAVVGATSPASLRAVRAVLPQAFILVPGYGAQGGDAAALQGIAQGPAAGFVVNASRSIIYAWREEGIEYRAAAAKAAAAMRGELGLGA